jgi:ubiquinone/menaquinone biosynthesis C-methylase UbiE
MANVYLSKEKVRAFYDRFGRRQDWQSFYEAPAMRELLLHGRFGPAGSVFELGFGTGAFALTLLERHLPTAASYVGVDISSTMAGIAGKRLGRFGPRARLVVTDGSLAFGFPDCSFDRFVSNYVMDILPPDDIRQAISEAHRMLKPGGLMCLTSLTYGRTPVSRALIWAWRRLFGINPLFVGGCRPVRLTEFLPQDRWRLDHQGVVQAFGIPSEVVVAKRLPD